MAAKSAIPTHLKNSAAANGDAADFARKHHGKTQSHVVRYTYCYQPTSLSMSMF
jgi:hypothetical protein